MSKSSDPYTDFQRDQIILAAIAQLPWAKALGKGIDLLVSNHCVLHGTPDKNVSSIMMRGFRESSGGMLGRGVYGAHSYEKAKGFAGRNGTVFCIRFSGKNVCLTTYPDYSGSWRAEGYDSIYCDRPGRRSEMCFKSENIEGYEKYTGSLSQKTRLKIDEFFLKNPKLQNESAYIAVAAEIRSKSHHGALLGATIGVAISAVIDNLVGRSSKVTPEEIAEAFAEGVAVGTVAGVAGGTATFAVASAATVEVAAGGVWGWMGFTTTTAAFSTAGAVGVAGAVALPLGAAAAAIYVVNKLQQRREDDDI